MSQYITFINFARAHGKVKLRPYCSGEDSWTALLCKDEDGNEVFISPPPTNVILSSDGEVLVDFNLDAEEIAEQIKIHKDNLVIRLDYIEDDNNPTYTLESKNTWIDEYGVVYSKDRKRLIKGTESVENYSVEEGTEAICEYAFDFDGCCKLKEIHLPFGLNVIGDHAFEGCKRLERIELPSTITEIGDKAFGCCHSLKKMVIPESVKIMGDGVFDGCIALKTLVFEGVVIQLGKIDEWFGSGRYAPINGKYLYGMEYEWELREYGYDIDESYYESEFNYQRKNWNELKILIPLGAESKYSELLDLYNNQKNNSEIESEDYADVSTGLNDRNLFVEQNENCHFEPFTQFVESFDKWEVHLYEDRNIIVCSYDDGTIFFIDSPSKDERSLTLVDFGGTTEEVSNAIYKNRYRLMVRYCLDEDDTLVGYPTLVDYTYYDHYLEKSYEWEIYKLRSHAFSDIRQISVKAINSFSDEEKDKLFEELNHGMIVPVTNEQLHAYMYCFGQMHEAKLRKAFSEIPENRFEPEIEIMDYACGQGIATLCFANFMENNDFFVETNNCATEIVKVTLIEPSAIALSRASLLCHKVCPKALIDTINSEFDELESSQVATTNIQRIHLLSNILDMTCYDINHLAKVIGKICKKEDIFICVDPWYHNKSLDGRQRKLMRLLNGKEIYLEAFNSGQLVPDKTWTAYITVFRI